MLSRARVGPPDRAFFLCYTPLFSGKVDVRHSCFVQKQGGIAALPRRLLHVFSDKDPNNYLFQSAPPEGGECYFARVAVGWKSRMVSIRAARRRRMLLHVFRVVFCDSPLSFVFWLRAFASPAFRLRYTAGRHALH